MVVLLALVGSLSAEAVAAEGAGREDQMAARRELVSIGVDFSVASLVQAVKENDPLVVELLIAGGMDVNRRDDEGNPLLSVAAGGGHAEVVRLLLIAGADPSASNRTGRTPLHAAAGKHAIREALVAAGADVRARDLEGHPPWAVYVYALDTSSVRFYFDHGASAADYPEALRTTLQAPFHHRPYRPAPFWDTQVEMFLLLLEHGADPNAGVPLGEVARTPGGADLARLLIQAGADPNASVGDEDYKRPVVFEALSQGAFEVARILLEAGADGTYIDPDGISYLGMALWNLEPGDCERNEHYATVEACLDDIVEIVRVLVRTGASVIGNRDGSSELDWLEDVADPARQRTLKALLKDVRVELRP